MVHYRSSLKAYHPLQTTANHIHNIGMPEPVLGKRFPVKGSRLNKFVFGTRILSIQPERFTVFQVNGHLFEDGA